VGYAICLMDIYMGMYYNTIIGWALYYLIASFQSELPWTQCTNIWNTPDCRPVTELTPNFTASSPAREFFDFRVGLFLVVERRQEHWQGGLDNSTRPLRGPDHSPSAGGIPPRGGGRHPLLPNPRLGQAVHLQGVDSAASQIFFSLGPGFGTLLALSSYNKFNNNCYRDAILTSTINCLTSFLAGFVIFSVLGYMAHVQQKSIEQVGLEGPGLVFIVYPEAIATMSGSVFWSIIFFLMLITLGLDSTFGGLEAMITALCDEYPRALGRHRETFVAVLLFGIYICALPTTTYGGVYLVNMLNVYGPGLAILFVVFVEAAGVCWIYGTDNFARDIEKMIGHRPGIFWRICWKYISPVFILASAKILFLFFSLLSHEQMLGTEYAYPEWSLKVGYVLTASSIICIPIYVIYKFVITPGSLVQVFPSGG
ncbi:hypothetical protein NQ317_018046, partial [Molorchus minor]